MMAQNLVSLVQNESKMELQLKDRHECDFACI